MFNYENALILYCSITSWNEWGEGTQIEPAAATDSTKEFLGLTTDGNKVYSSYPGDDLYFYTNKTKEHITEYREPETRTKYRFPKHQGQMAATTIVKDGNEEIIDSPSTMHNVKIRQVNGILEYL